MPRLDINEARIVELDGKKYACCSEGCEWILRTWPEAYRQAQAVLGQVPRLGPRRHDHRPRAAPCRRKHLIGQPLLEMERMWTIDDIRRLDYEVKDPLQASERVAPAASADAMIDVTVQPFGHATTAKTARPCSRPLCGTTCC